MTIVKGATFTVPDMHGAKALAGVPPTSEPGAEDTHFHVDDYDEVLHVIDQALTNAAPNAPWVSHVDYYWGEGSAHCAIIAVDPSNATVGAAEKYLVEHGIAHTTERKSAEEPARISVGGMTESEMVARDVLNDMIPGARVLTATKEIIGDLVAEGLIPSRWA
jgi:hypothetical protein